MPYFVYAVRPFAQLEHLADFDTYRPASLHAKVLRAAQPADSPVRIKVMFAETAEAAEDLLCAVRDPRPTGEDD